MSAEHTKEGFACAVCGVTIHAPLTMNDKPWVCKECLEKDLKACPLCSKSNCSCKFFSELDYAGKKEPFVYKDDVYVSSNPLVDKPWVKSTVEVFTPLVSQPPVWIIGIPGSGKTTLSNRIGAYDLDKIGKKETIDGKLKWIVPSERFLQVISTFQCCVGICDNYEELATFLEPRVLVCHHDLSPIYKKRNEMKQGFHYDPESSLEFQKKLLAKYSALPSHKVEEIRKLYLMTTVDDKIRKLVPEFINSTVEMTKDVWHIYSHDSYSILNDASSKTGRIIIDFGDFQLEESFHNDQSQGPCLSGKNYMLMPYGIKSTAVYHEQTKKTQCIIIHSRPEHMDF